MGSQLTRRAVRAFLIALAVIGAAPGLAAAFGPPANSDPAANFPIHPPNSCWQSGVNARCINDAVATLNAARATLNQPPYALPADFTTLDPTQQVLILSNLDRALYGLPPIPGLTAALNADAAAGANADADPHPSGGTFNGWTSNWAGGYPNIVYAYEGWMFDDGLGSGNLDCTAQNTSGCWGHRHDILWDFSTANPLAMGVASVTDPGGMLSYAQLLVAGNGAYVPSYVYTWAQAQADGAGTNAYDPATAGPSALQLTIAGSGSVSDGSGAACTATCSLAELVGKPTTLTATPAAGQLFVGWSGACSGTDVCSVTPAAASVAVTATFAPIPPAATPVPTPTPTPVPTKTTTTGGSSTTTTTGTPKSSDAFTIKVLTKAHRTVRVKIMGPTGVKTRCALTKASVSSSHAHYATCGTTATYRNVAPGTYTLRIHSTAGNSQFTIKVTR